MPDHTVGSIIVNDVLTRYVRQEDKLNQNMAHVEDLKKDMRKLENAVQKANEDFAKQLRAMQQSISNLQSQTASMVATLGHLDSSVSRIERLILGQLKINTANSSTSQSSTETDQIPPSPIGDSQSGDDDTNESEAAHPLSAHPHLALEDNQCNSSSIFHTAKPLILLSAQPIAMSKHLPMSTAEPRPVDNSYIISLTETEDLDGHLLWMKDQTKKYSNTEHRCQVIDQYDAVLNAYAANLSGNALQDIKDCPDVKVVAQGMHGSLFAWVMPGRDFSIPP